MTPPTALQNSGDQARLQEDGHTWSGISRRGAGLWAHQLPTLFQGTSVQVSPCPGWERELRTPTSLRWIPVGRGTVRGLGSGLRNRGSPRESLAQLEAGSRQKATCSQDACAFSNIPTATLWGHFHPQSHTKPARVECWGGGQQ